MPEEFENIVVGAGIAGTIRGGNLSKHVQKTLLSEKGNCFS
jgi:flavin-dependent dehydrogenase